MNQVHVDESELAAEAAAAVHNAPVELMAGTDAEAGAPVEGEQVAPVGESWGMFCTGLVPVLSVTLLPQWNLTKDEQGELSSSIGLCLDQLLPGGMDGKYACWARLFVCVGGITASRAIMGGGKLPGFGPRRVAKEKNEQATAEQPVTN